jgi:hypothetical protein
MVLKYNEVSLLVSHLLSFTDFPFKSSSTLNSFKMVKNKALIVRLTNWLQFTAINLH